MSCLKDSYSVKYTFVAFFLRLNLNLQSNSYNWEFEEEEQFEELEFWKKSFKEPLIWII